MSQGGVLIVEDDIDLRETLGDLFDSSGLAPIFKAGSLVDVVGFGPEMLECTLALVDVNLGPDAPSGLDVHDWLRSKGFRGRFVFVTGHASSHSLVRRAKAIGGVGVLQKPIDLGVLEGLAHRDA